MRIHFICILCTLTITELISRLVITYASGLLILWGLHENKVLAVRGGTKRQRQLLAEHGAHLQDSACTEVLDDQLHFSPPKGTINLELDEEEKEICTVCWAYGNTLVAGYVDGDVWLWSFPLNTKGRSETDFPFSSGEPLRKLELVPGKSSRMPVIVLSWSPSRKGSKNGAGQLYVFGGGEVGSPEVLTVSYVPNFLVCKMVVYFVQGEEEFKVDPFVEKLIFSLYVYIRLSPWKNQARRCLV
jgi:hypothetical protein